MVEPELESTKESKSPIAHFVLEVCIWQCITDSTKAEIFKLSKLVIARSTDSDYPTAFPVSVAKHLFQHLKWRDAGLSYGFIWRVPSSWASHIVLLFPPPLPLLRNSRPPGLTSNVRLYRGKAALAKCGQWRLRHGSWQPPRCTEQSTWRDTK